MEFFAFIVLAAVAMLLLVAVAKARVKTDRKKRELEQLEQYRRDEKRERLSCPVLAVLDYSKPRGPYRPRRRSPPPGRRGG